MALIKRYGQMWARNAKNIRAIPKTKDGGQGVYILYDGSMPVYVGKGNIHSQISRAARIGSRKNMWEHFSWYIPTSPELIHDLEVLFLRVLPRGLHVLNKQGGDFKVAHDDGKRRRFTVPDVITRENKKRRKRKA